LILACTLFGVSLSVFQQNDKRGAVAKRVTPAQSWCSIVNQAQPGTEIAFAPGDYVEPCSIRVSGTAVAAIIIRSEDNRNARARFSYPGATSNVLEVFGSYLTIQGFEFRPNSDSVTSVRLMGGARNITLERNVFGGLGNVAVNANSGNTANLIIRDNVFLNLENTAVYIGCHDGSCISTNLLFERNFITGVRASDPGSVGYGIEVKLNSWGVLRDNTIVNTKGPPIMTYGLQQGDQPSTIEGNYVEGSRREGGIVIGGGPAIVRNNIAVSNAYGGISAQNYNLRNLQRNVWIVHNTLINNGDSGINTQGWSPAGNNVIANNAILPKASTVALRPAVPAGRVSGNVTCTAACFVNAVTAPYDLTPAARSPLLDVSPFESGALRTLEDFMGTTRGASTAAGAMERSSAAGGHPVGPASLRPPRVASGK